MQYPGTLFTADISNTFTAEHRDAKREITQRTLISWFKDWTADTHFFTIGVSTIGGADIIYGKEGSVQYWDKFNYEDETDRVKEMSVERSFNEPAIGTVGKALADIKLSNCCQRYTPKAIFNKYKDDFEGTFTSTFETVPDDMSASWDKNANTTMGIDFDEPSTSELGYWKFDGDATDSSGNGRDLTENGGIDYHRFGKLNQCIDFDGAADYLSRNDASFNMDSGTLCIEAWFRNDALSGQDTIVEMGADGTQNYLLETTTVMRFAFYDAVPAVHRYTCTTTLSTGKWYHVVLVHTWGDATSTKVYLNGELETGSWSAGAGGGTPQTGDSNLYIGATSTPANWWNGCLDEIRILNRGLTANEAKLRYAQSLSGSSNAQHGAEGHGSRYSDMLPSGQKGFMESPTELIRNGSFEEGGSHWLIYEDRSIAQGDGAFSVNYISTDKKDASYCCRLTNTATNSQANVNFQYIVLEPNTTYYMSVQVKTTGHGSAFGSYVRAYEYNSAYGVLATNTVALVKTDHDWTEYTLSFTSNANTAYGRIDLCPGRATGATPSILYVDKIRLSTSATDYDRKGGIERNATYEDFIYQAKLRNKWEKTQYNSCDATTNWTEVNSAALTIDTDDKKEGTGSLVFSKDAVAAYCYINYALANQDISGHDYLYLWFKTPATAELANITHLSLLFYTTSIANYWAYYIDKARQFPTGETWYRIPIDKNKASTRTGTLDWTDIDGFRFYVYTSAAANLLGNMKIDDISFQNIRGIEKGVYFRATDEDNCYRFVTKQPDKIAFQKLEDGIISDEQVTNYETYTAEQIFKVDAHDDRIQCYICRSDAESREGCYPKDRPDYLDKKFDVEDTTYKKGKIGIFNNVGHDHIDDVSVSKEHNIKDYILPSRPIRLYDGYDINGFKANVPKFVGLTKGMPNSDYRKRDTQIQANDFLDYIMNKKIDNTAMWTAEWTDTVIEDLMINECGFATSQFDLDQGINRIPFGYVDKGGSLSSFLKDLVEAELGYFFQDENGIIRFWNRHHFNELPNNRPCRNILTSQVIEESIPRDDKILNVVEVEGKPRRRESTQPLWEQPQKAELNPSGKTSLWYNFSDPMWAITTPQANVHYTANTKDDDTGENITSDITVSSIHKFSTSCNIVWNNANSSRAYLSLTLWGEPCKPIGDVYYRSQCDCSVTAYGEENHIHKIDNDFISQDYCESLAKLILGDYCSPHDHKELTIKAIPELQLGDMVSYGGRWWLIYSIKEQLSPGSGFIQQLKLVRKTVATYFRIGISLIGSKDKIAP
jgi:hypothetical protein